MSTFVADIAEPPSAAGGSSQLAGGPSPLPQDGETLPPIRLIRFEDLKSCSEFPRYPDDEHLCKVLEDVDRDDSFIVFVSHCWMRGHPAAEGYDKRAHPDNVAHGKFKLILEGIEKAWRGFAPGMADCYVWLDYSCINQNLDPAGELKQLDKIVQACDCLITPIIDPEWRRWQGAVQRGITNWIDDYKAPLWCEGPHAYLNRAWCRMEMLYAANQDLLAGTEPRARAQKFVAGFRKFIERNFRPHLLYGTLESEPTLTGAGHLPKILPPLQNNFIDSHNPSKGNISNESDRPKIAELMAALTIRRVVERYEGERNERKEMHGQGKLIRADGCIIEGEFADDEMHGYCSITYTGGDVYEGFCVRGEKHGHGKYTEASGGTFEGEYVEGRKQGPGRWALQNGSIYEGELRNDVPHGRGKFTLASGKVMDGLWDRGNFARELTIKELYREQTFGSYSRPY